MKTTITVTIDIDILRGLDAQIERGQRSQKIQELIRRSLTEEEMTKSTLANGSLPEMGGEDDWVF